MNRSLLLLSALLLTLASVACSGSDAGGDGWGTRTDVEAIFQKDCGSCHGSAWTSCWGNHDAASTLTQAIQSGAMPQSGPMAPEDKATVLEWLQAGAPCAGSDPGGGGQVPVAGSGAL
jgi:hypothetical protein